MASDKAKVTASNFAFSPWRFLILVLFCASGATALVYEVVWSRLFVHIFGATLPATATVLSAFMAGMAIGGLVAGQFVARLVNPLRYYAFLELILGLLGYLVTWYLCQGKIEIAWVNLYLLGGSNQELLVLSRFLMCFAVVGVPSVLMGATFLLLVQQIIIDRRDVHSSINYLYAVNTAGAALGTICSGFILIPSLGLLTTSVVAASMNILIGLTAYCLWHFHVRKVKGSEQPLQLSGNKTDLKNKNKSAPYVVPAVLFATTISGMLVMMLEVLWTRVLSLVLGSSTYAFSTMLFVFLVGLAAGSWVVARYKSKLQPTLLSMAFVYFACALYLYLTLFFIEYLPTWLIVLENQACGSAEITFAWAIVCRIAVSAAVMLPPAVMLGALFPLAVCVLVDSSAEACRLVALLYSLETSGAIFGAWLAGFLFIPWASRIFLSGMEMTFVLLASLSLLMAAFVIIISLSIKYKAAQNGPMIACLCSMVPLLILFIFTVRPIWNVRAMSAGLGFFSRLDYLDLSSKKLSTKLSTLIDRGKEPACKQDGEIIFYREGLNTTVTVGQVPDANVTYLKNDGKVEVSVPTDVSMPAPLSDLPTQVLLGQLPMLVCKDAAKSALLIGYGSGITAGSLLTNCELESLVIVEQEECVLAADRFFQHVNNSPLAPGARNSGRVNVIVDDARSYLTTQRKNFDAIVCQPAEPWIGTSCDLFTYEFWRLARSRLKENGVFCQWVQLYGINPRYLGVLCRTFFSIFPETIVFHPPDAGELLLIGFKRSAQINAHQMTKCMLQPAVRQDLLRIGVYHMDQLIHMLTFSPREFHNWCQRLAQATGDKRLNTDENLLAEYQLPPLLFTNKDLLAENLQWIPQTSGDKEHILIGFLPKEQLPVSSSSAIPGVGGQRMARLEAALRADPLNVQLLNSLAMCMIKQGMLLDAETRLRQSLTLDPTQFETRLVLAELLCQDKKPELGLVQLKAASRQRPERTEPYLFAAVYFLEQKQWQLALANLKLYEMKGGTDVDAWLLRRGIKTCMDTAEQMEKAFTTGNIQPIRAKQVFEQTVARWQETFASQTTHPHATDNH